MIAETKKMFAGVVHGKQDIRFEEIQMPELKKNEVLVEVKMTGICGSDVPRVNEGTCHFYPIVLGHEFSGVVADVGTDVTSIEIGTHVAGVPLVPCMQCEDCKKGNYSLCKKYSFIGSRQNGSFAQYVAVPETNVIPLDNSVTFEQGAFFEPATVALHGLRCANFQGGKTVAVLGAGTVGLLTMQWAKIFGASKVIVVNRSRQKLETAKDLGADAVVSSLDENYREQLMDLTDNRGFDYVFETAGSVEMMKTAFYSAANKADVCFIGTPKEAQTFSVAEWEMMNRKEFNMTGSWMSYSAPFPGEEWCLTAHCFQSGQLKIDTRMIDKVIPLRDIAKAFALYKENKVRGKILIDSQG